MRKAPPPVREKPKKAQSLDYGLLGGPEGEEEEKKMPVGASAPMSELASVLKKGIATPLKPRVGELSSEFVVVCKEFLKLENITVKCEKVTSKK